MRALKLATVSQFDKFESESQNLLGCYDNDLLRKKKKFYRELQNSGKLIWGQDNNQKDKEEGDESSKKKSHIDEKGSGKKQRRVIAPRTFLFNPKNNEHRIIKTKNDLLVLNMN